MLVEHIGLQEVEQELHSWVLILLELPEMAVADQLNHKQLHQLPQPAVFHIQVAVVVQTQPLTKQHMEPEAMAAQVL
jgi:hypothetical protein